MITQNHRVCMSQGMYALYISYSSSNIYVLQVDMLRLKSHTVGHCLINYFVSIMTLTIAFIEAK